MSLSLGEFSAYMGKWAEKYRNDFHLYYPLKGGWEAWVQASVAGYIINADSTIDILREQLIFYGSQQKVDWLLNDNDHSVANKVAIELKCESFENRSKFVSGLKGDIAKLADGKLKPDYRGCQTAVVGLCFTNAALQWMVDNKFKILDRSEDTAIGLFPLT